MNRKYLIFALFAVVVLYAGFFVVVVKNNHVRFFYDTDYLYFSQNKRVHVAMLKLYSPVLFFSGSRYKFLSASEFDEVSFLYGDAEIGRDTNSPPPGRRGRKRL